MIYSQISADGPLSCGRSACGRWVNDWQQALFIVSNQVTIPFCCQACFAMSCQELLLQQQETNPLARLGYISQDS